MKPHILPLLLGVLILYSSCSHGNPTVSRSLDRIESLVEEHRDSALLELVRLDSLIESGTVRIEGERQQARYALLKTQTHDKNFIDDTSDSLIQTAVRFYDEHGSDRERMLAHFYHGAIFRNAKNYGAAFVAYRKAEQIALALDDNHYLCLIYGNLSSLSYATYSKDAIMYSQKNMDYALRSDDIREYYQAKADMAKTYSSRLNYDSAGVLFRQVLDSLPASDPIVQSCLTTYIEQCVTTEQYNLADSLLNMVINNMQPVNLLNKACLFQLKGNTDSADVYIHKAKLAIKYPQHIVFYYEKLSWINELRCNYVNALDYKRKRLNAQNEIVTSIFSNSVSDYQRDFEIQQKIHADEQYYQYRRWSTLVAALCLLLVSIAFNYLYRLYKTRSKMLENTIKQYVDQIILTEDKETTLGTLEEQIEELKQKLKTSQSMDMAGKLAKLFVDRLNFFDRFGIVLYKSKGQLGFKQNIYSTVEEMMKRLHSDPIIIQEIDRMIDESYDEAMTKAKQEECLTTTDIIFLRYILMNLSYPAIAYLFDSVDINTLYKRMDRLKIKLRESNSDNAKALISLLHEKGGKKVQRKN